MFWWKQDRIIWRSHGITDSFYPARGSIMLIRVGRGAAIAKAMIATCCRIVHASLWPEFCKLNIIAMIRRRWEIVWRKTYWLKGCNRYSTTLYESRTLTAPLIAMYIRRCSGWSVNDDETWGLQLTWVYGHRDFALLKERACNESSRTVNLSAVSRRFLWATDISEPPARIFYNYRSTWTG